MLMATQQLLFFYQNLEKHYKHFIQRSIQCKNETSVFEHGQNEKVWNWKYHF